MASATHIPLTPSQRKVITLVTFSNMLEGYDIYSFAFLGPLLAKAFFHFDSYLSDLLSVFIVFGSSCIARQFGAIIFGRIGDLLGRKRAFISSIIILTLPTFTMGCLPTYDSLGMYAPILLYYFRVMQSIAIAGEAPGTFCFLYEKAEIGQRKFMTSWGAYGNQIGAILALIESAIMAFFMSDEFLSVWGWRISFWNGGLICLLGLYLRRKLAETASFLELEHLHKLDKVSIGTVLKQYMKRIWLGTGYGALNADIEQFPKTFF